MQSRFLTGPSALFGMTRVVLGGSYRGADALRQPKAHVSASVVEMPCRADGDVRG